MHYEADPEVSRTAESLAGLSLQPKPNPLPLGHKRLPSYLSRDFHPCPWPKENDSFGHLGDVPTVSEQEQLLLRDLLYVLIGIEGKYIRLQQSNVPPRYNLTLDPSTDRHLVAITNQILVIPPGYSSIVAYVESRVYGQVNQALVAAMQRHLFDYNMLVGEMEELMLQEELSLQKMFYMLKPYFTTFKLLAELSKHLYSNMFIGGRVLTVLHEKAKSIQAMDNKALELLLALTKSASEPYFDILKMWIYYGQISDSRQEFFIVDTRHYCLGTSAGAAPGSAGDHGQGGGSINSIFDSDDDDDEFDDDFGKFGVKYWDLRYRINSFKTPIFLEKYEPMIYKTGKYVSIINKAKALLVKKSSRVPFASSLLNDQHKRHAQYQAARMEMMESSYSFDDLLRGVASMQITENPALPDVVVEESISFMSSISEVSDSFGPVIFTPKSEEIVYSFDDESTYGQPIRAAYEEASSQLLHLLMRDSQLVATFNAVKHYLLLAKGDFMVHFINFASKDLGSKRTDSLVQHRLDSMMGKAVGSSVAASDVSLLKNGGPHVEFTGKSFLEQIDKIMMKPLDSMDLDCTSSNSLNFLKEEFDDDEDDHQEEANKNAKLYCYESLALKFDVPFPLSLIFTQKSTVCYQLMFRYVFLCRYAEMELENTWKNNNVLNVHLKLCDQLAMKAAKDGLEPEDSVRNLVSAFKNVHKKAFVLRYKMIAFVRNFHYFYALEVIEPLCGQFISQLNPKRGTSLDSVIECHEKFLERCFASSSLTSLEITSIIINIFMLCIELSHALKESNDPDTSMMESSCFFGRSQTHNPYSEMDFKSRDSLNDAPESKSTLDSQLHEKLREIVEKANGEFDSLVAKLLEKIYSDNCGQYHMMYPFVARLNFNDFYGSKISA